MSANAFDTLKAAKSLKAAGFDEAQAEAVVATVGDAVRGHTAPLANTAASIADRMATKDDIADMATKDDVAKMVTKDEFAMLVDKVATKEYVKAAIAVEMKALYRHLWVMGTSVVGVTVALTKLLP